MEGLIQNSRTYARLAVQEAYHRPLYQQIAWDWRLNGIRGPRGVGKTTLMLQRLLATDPNQQHSIYMTLDDLFFANNHLIDVVRNLHQNAGITHFYLDEVHKYPTWSRELKNIYDLLPNLHITFTGSSIIQLFRQDVDLSRRAVIYDLQGLSFREYLLLDQQIELPTINFPDLLADPRSVSLDILPPDLAIHVHFQRYLQKGYYPIVLENEALYSIRIKQMIDIVLRVDLSSSESGQTRDIRSLERLLLLIAESLPFKPNFSKIAEHLQINRQTLSRYFQLLEEAQLIRSYEAAGKGFSKMQKPEKVYLDNPNLADVIATGRYNVGAQREVFFQNQVRLLGQINIPQRGDFLLNNEYLFEVGGPNKKSKQIKGITKAYLAVADTDTGIGNQIPLWLFGLLY